MIEQIPSPIVDRPRIGMPPPLIYIIFFLCGFAIQKNLTIPGIPVIAGRICGTVLITIGFAIAFWSFNLFRRAGASPLPIKPSTALVIRGPYRFSRNPMYLGLAIAYVGLALWLNLLGSVVLLPLAILALNCFVICKEEQYLERTFGEEYLNYKARVRRWI